MKTNAQNINQNFISWIINNGKRISTYNIDVASTTTLYQVPQGKVFYLLFCGTSFRSAGTNTGSGGLVTNNNAIAITYYDIPAIVTNNSYCTTFPYPLQFFPGETLNNVAVGAGNRVTSTIWGYELDASLVPYFS